MSTKLSELRASLENTLNEQHERYLQDIDHFQKELQELKETFVKVASNKFTFSERIKLFFNKEQEIQLKAFLTPLQQQYETVLSTQLEHQQGQHSAVQANKQALFDETLVLESDFSELKNEHTVLNSKHSEIKIRYEIIKHLLSARNEAPGITAYRTALYEDFIQFANDENSLEAEAEAILELQEIEKELEVVSVSPEFHSKRSVAVAGGFSAGKSEFISSFFLEDSLRLPIGIEPTSAIPVYVLNSIQGTGFMGYSSSGGMVDLLQIDPDISHKLSHNFIKTFGFNLKQIMPFVFLTTKINYDHLCFVDTPGYNPSDTDGSFQDEDLTTAEEFVHNAEALVWLIGMDAHGTISRSDLDFLEKVTQQEKNKPLYIVLNKADVKLLDDIEEIMEVVAETLDDYDIKYEGISAYSSISKTEYLYREQSLYDFFKKIDKRSDKQKLVLQKLYDVDERYQYAILKDMKQDRQVVSMLNSLKLDLLQSELGLDIGTTSSETLSKMDSWFDSSEKYERQLTALKEAVEKLRDAIDTVFGQRSKHPRKVVNIEDVRMDERYYKKGRA